MTLELNEAQLPGEEQTLSLLADEGQLTCITGGTSARRTRWLHVMMGFETLSAGYVSVDGEPLTGGCIAHLRKNIAFVPDRLDVVGNLMPYAPPTIHDVLSLRSNYRLSITEADVKKESLRTGATGQKALLLALAVLRRQPVLLVDSPSPLSAAYLQKLASQERRTVIIATDDAAIAGLADSIAELI